jgi:hypothetical protein
LNFGKTATSISHRLRQILFGCACYITFGLGCTAGANEPVKMTGPSPFATCTADDVAGQSGTNYRNAEVEPWVAADPLDSNYLIAGWQQDRWSNGGARSLMSAYSEDGGATWSQVVVPGISKCSGGSFDRATDPWVTIAPNGTAYFMSLSFMEDEPSGANGGNAILVNRSFDGGQTWEEPQTLIFDTDGQIFNDKSSITADPHDSRYVYAVWDRYIDFTLPHWNFAEEAQSVTRGGRMRHGDGAAARERLRKVRAQLASGTAKPAATFTAPIYFARTTNGGKLWKKAKMIFDPGPDGETVGNLIEVLPNGNVLNFFTNLLADGSVNFSFLKSTDHGETFGSVKRAFDMVITNHATVSPNKREPVRDGSTLFDTAVDKENGTIYVVWQDGRWGDIDKVGFSMSTDNGRNWSAPIQINQTPISRLKFRNQAFIPSVEIGANHRVYVTYYDFRNDLSDDKELVDLWAVSCDPDRNCSSELNWGNEIRLTGQSFDILKAPYDDAYGYFLGDYQGLVSRGSFLTAVFAKSVGPNLNDIYAKSFR